MVLGMGQVHSGTDAGLGLFYGRGKTLLDVRTTLMQTDSIQKRSFYLHSTIPLAVPAWFACL
jgi:hypothetical protein